MSLLKVAYVHDPFESGTNELKIEEFSTGSMPFIISDIAHYDEHDEFFIDHFYNQWMSPWRLVAAGTLIGLANWERISLPLKQEVGYFFSTTDAAQRFSIITEHDKLIEFSNNLRKRIIHTPDISVDVFSAISKDDNILECFLKIVSNLKKILLDDRRIEKFNVTRLRDPEGSELRVYFDILTKGLSLKNRKNFRRRLNKIIDESVASVIKELQLDDDEYINLRVIFGVTVE